MSEYWDNEANFHGQLHQYSRFGLIAAPYWRMERRLIAKLSLSHLLPTLNNRRLRLLKSDLWNEGVDNKSGDIYDFLGEEKEAVEIVGIDISQVICNSTKNMMYKEEIMIACADMRKLPFRSETFDAIFDVSALDHIHPTQIASVINEYKRTLKDGGILTLIFDSETFWWLRYARKIFNRLRYKHTSSFTLWWCLSPEWIIGKLGESGFTILNEFPLGILSLSPLYLKTWQSKLVRKVVPELLRGLIGSMKFARALKYLFPLSSQHLIVVKK